jgi:REP element-mobilizing transposase RayT
MPNHMHGILILQETEKPLALGEIIRRFKAWTTKQFRDVFTRDPEATLWQRNYHEHGIRE